MRRDGGCGVVASGGLAHNASTSGLRCAFRSVRRCARTACTPRSCTPEFAGLAVFPIPSKYRAPPRRVVVVVATIRRGQFNGAPERQRAEDDNQSPEPVAPDSGGLHRRRARRGEFSGAGQGRSSTNPNSGSRRTGRHSNAPRTNASVQARPEHWSSSSVTGCGARRRGTAGGAVKPRAGRGHLPAADPVRGTLPGRFRVPQGEGDDHPQAHQPERHRGRQSGIGRWRAPEPRRDRHPASPRGRRAPFPGGIMD